MRRTTALLSLVLVAVALAGVSAAGPTASSPAAGTATGGLDLVASPSPNATEYLALPRGTLTSSSYETASLDVAGAVAVETARYRGQHRIMTVRERFYSTEDSDDRQEIVENALQNVSTRVEQLQRHQRAALRGYSDDSIGADQFLREIARIEAAAAEQSRIVSIMLNEFQSAPGFSINNRTPFNTVRGEVATIEGPVRAQLSRALDGSRGRVPLYVETSREGLVLARTTGDVYHRDSFAGSLREASGTDLFSQSGNAINAASTRARELYPWLAEVVQSVTALGDTGIYRARMTRDHVSATVYLDGNTTTVFREVQQRTLSEIHLGDARTAVNGSVRITVNRTHDTGPMLVSLERTATGVPTAGAVTVNGRAVGETGPDGTLWIVEPRGEATIVANTPDGRVAITL